VLAVTVLPMMLTFEQRTTWTARFAALLISVVVKPAGGVFRSVAIAAKISKPRFVAAAEFGA
jgi:hypothetical protein